MIWVALLILVVLVVVATALAVLGKWTPIPPPEPTTDLRDPGLPAGFVASDIESVRFDVGLRGYRMAQVDAVLYQLETRIAELESSRRE